MQETLVDTATLPVMESFYTIQGEGFYQGKAAYFIRLGGCDVGCVWCDVKDSWDASRHPQRSIEEIVAEVAGACPPGGGGGGGGGEPEDGPVVVITGGEPLMHNLDTLTQALKAKGYRTNLETSGSWPLSGTWDWICL